MDWSRGKLTPEKKNIPIGSMYAIYGNIYHQYTPVMLAYIPYMDPMGYGKIFGFRLRLSNSSGELCRGTGQRSAAPGADFGDGGADVGADFGVD